MPFIFNLEAFMSSQVDICNMALTRLGAGRITSLGDNTVEAKALSAIYNQVAKYVMAKAPWPSIRYRATLAQTTNTPAFGFNYEYQLPTNPKCLRVIRLNEFKLGTISFQIEQDKLLTDEIAVDILYLGYITDTEAYDIYLEEAIMLRLCYELSYAKVGQYQVAAMFRKELQEEFMDLINNACSQYPTDELPSDMFIDVRNEG